MNIFKEDKYIISYALNLWANYIETGDITMSSEDAKIQGREDEINILDENQMKFLLRLKKMKRKVLEYNTNTKNANKN